MCVTNQSLFVDLKSTILNPQSSYSSLNWRINVRRYTKPIKWIIDQFCALCVYSLIFITTFNGFSPVMSMGLNGTRFRAPPIIHIIIIDSTLFICKIDHQLLSLVYPPLSGAIQWLMPLPSWQKHVCIHSIIAEHLLAYIRCDGIVWKILHLRIINSSLDLLYLTWTFRWKC